MISDAYRVMLSRRHPHSKKHERLYMTRSIYLLLCCAALVAISGCGKQEKPAEDVASVNRKLQEGDALVQKWADKLQPEAKGNFVQHEGLTETDPWGNYLRLTYDHSTFTETLEIRSAGADKGFETADDLVRKREHRSATAFLGGSRTTGTDPTSGSAVEEGWGWPVFAGIWLVLGVFALIIAEGRRKRANRSLGARAGESQSDGTLRRTTRQRRGIIGAAFIVLFGGIALAATLTSAFFGLFDCDPCDCAGKVTGRRGAAACGDLFGDCDCDMPDSDCGGCDCGGCDAPDCGGCDCGGCDGCDCDCG